MSSNPQSSGTQVPRPPLVGSVGSQNFMQFQPVTAQQQQQQAQSFILAGSQQFRPVGQGPHIQFSQTMQKVPSRPPSSQAFPISYGQPNMAVAAASPQPQHSYQPVNTHASGVGGFGMAPSYIFTPSPYGQPPNTINMSAQYQPSSQMYAPVIPIGGQPWLSSGSHSLPTHVEQLTGQQPSVMVSTLAREQAEKMSSQGAHTDTALAAQAPVSVNVPAYEVSSISVSAMSGVISSPVSVTPVVPAANSFHLVALGSQSTPILTFFVPINFVGGHSPVVSITPSHAAVTGTGIPADLSIGTTLMTDNIHPQDVPSAANGASMQDLEEDKKRMAVAGKINVTVQEDKTVDDEPFPYPSKQAMKISVNDKRYPKRYPNRLPKRYPKGYPKRKTWMLLKKPRDEERRIKREKAKEKTMKIMEARIRKREQNHRDDFLKLMEEDIAAGVLTAKTHWRDYYVKVKATQEFDAVSFNASGSTPYDLFEDVVEDLVKQYHEDKYRIKASVKLKKINLTSTWTLEDLKNAISDETSSPQISNINFKLVYDELLERIKENEEKEAKKRQRLTDDFNDLLYSIKEITASSIWEDSRKYFEDSQEYRSIGDANFKKEIFEEYISLLQKKAKEKDLKMEEEKVKKEKEKEEKKKKKKEERKEKERERERDKGKEQSKKDESEDYSLDVTDVKEEKRKDRD